MRIRRHTVDEGLFRPLNPCCTEIKSVGCEEGISLFTNKAPCALDRGRGDSVDTSDSRSGCIICSITLLY
jgi:hypothetical protein